MQVGAQVVEDTDTARLCDARLAHGMLILARPFELDLRRGA